jgi:hypothetical protein
MTVGLYGRLNEFAAPKSHRTQAVDDQQSEPEPSFAEKTGSDLANPRSGSLGAIDATMRLGAAPSFLSDLSVDARNDGILSDGFKFHDVQFFDSQQSSISKASTPLSATLADSDSSGLRSLPSVELAT